MYICTYLYIINALPSPTGIVFNADVNGAMGGPYTGIILFINIIFCLKKKKNYFFFTIFFI